jgi:hypothetical protein
MRKKRQIFDTPMYVIVNKNGEVFAGLLSGYPQWSSNWNNAKPLPRENTTFICDSNPNHYELINENEF